MKESEKEQAELSCDIVGDLLPLYYDEVVSEDTRQAVARHLTTCDKCLKEYNLLKENLVEPAECKKKEKDENRVGDFLKEVSKKGILKGVVLTLIVAAFLLGARYVLVEIPLVPVSSKDISVEHVFEEEGSFFIAYKAPRYTCPTEIITTYDKDKKQVSLNYKIPILGFPFGHKKEVKIMTIDKEYLQKEGFTPEDIFYNGEKIYERKDAANQKEVPEYVKVYFEYSNSEYGFGVSLDENTIELSLITDEDGNEMEPKYKIWDWEGNLLHDSEQEK